MTKIATAFSEMSKRYQSDEKFRKQVRESGLSWRVHLLPFLGHEELYAKFNHYKSWRHPLNAELILQIPEEFRFQSSHGRTRFRIAPPSFVQERVSFAVFEDITDPVSLTAVIHYSAPHQQTIWTKPDLDCFGTDDQLQALIGWNPDDRVLVGMADAQSKVFPSGMPRDVRHSIFTWNGSEKIDLEQALKEPVQATTPSSATETK